MTPDNTLAALALPTVAQRCRQESELYFQQQPFDPRFCYELFRRAIVERIERAWELVYRQYTPLVRQWVKLHPSFAHSGEEVDHFVNSAFMKMWSAVKGEKFHKFADLKALLEYLKLCVGSSVIDHARSTRAAQYDQPLLDPEQGPDDDDRVQEPGVDASLLEAWARDELWQRIRQRLHDEREYTLLYYRFVLGLKPKEICQRFSQEFPEVNEIYAMLQNILARLRRDPELRKFLDGDA